MLSEWKTTWTLHDIKRITCQRLPHQVLYLLSYGMLCHDGNFLMTQPVNKLKNVVIQFTFSSSTFGMFAS